MMKNLLIAASLLALAPTASFAQTLVNPMRVMQQQTQMPIKAGGIVLPGMNVAPMANAEGTVELGYCNPSDEVQGVGVGQPATLHTCIFLPADMLPSNPGATVDFINFALTTTNQLSDVSIWIRKDLKAEPVYTQAIEKSQLAKGWNKITLDTPFELDGKGIYVGYSLTTSAPKGSNDAFPVGTSGQDAANGLILGIENQGFQDYNGQGLGVLALMAGVTGEFPDNDVNFVSASAFNAVINKPVKVTGEFRNSGISELKSVEVKYTLNGETGTSKVTFDTPLAFNHSAFVEFETGVLTESGIYSVDLEVTKFNDVEDSNANNNKQSVADIICASQEVPRVTVMEQGTGTWCGYCPRGHVAMEKLEKAYGDKFIGIAAHASGGLGASDPMQISDYRDILNFFPGFPNALVDRRYINDPYFGIEEVYEICNAIPSEGSINVAAKFTDDTKKAIEVTSNSTFYYNSDENPYRVAYVLVEDSIKGYTQANYYSGMSGLPEDLEFLASEPSTIRDMVFNDVAVGAYECMGIEGSLEGAVTDGGTKSHTYTITLPSRIKDINNVRLIAMLVTNSEASIAVVNAAEIALKDVEVGSVAVNKLDAEIVANDGELYVSANSGKTNTLEVYSTTGVLMNKVVFEGNASVKLPEGNVYIVRVNDGNNVVVKKVIM